MKEERIDKMEFALWAGIAGNITLATMKGFVGLITGSKALIAGAAHSASDAADSLAIAAGIRISRQENDQELMKAALGVKGVVAIDSLHAREQGHYVIVDVKISVNPRITVVEGHDVGKAVKSLLMDRFSHISDVQIHVNPYDPGYPYKSNDDAGQEDFPTMLH